MKFFLMFVFLGALFAVFGSHWFVAVCTWTFNAAVFGIFALWALVSLIAHAVT